MLRMNEIALTMVRRRAVSAGARAVTQVLAADSAHGGCGYSRVYRQGWCVLNGSDEQGRRSLWRWPRRLLHSQRTSGAAHLMAQLSLSDGPGEPAPVALHWLGGEERRVSTSTQLAVRVRRTSS